MNHDVQQYNIYTLHLHSGVPKNLSTLGQTSSRDAVLYVTSTKNDLSIQRYITQPLTSFTYVIYFIYYMIL